LTGPPRLDEHIFPLPGRAPEGPSSQFYGFVLAGSADGRFIEVAAVRPHYLETSEMNRGIWKRAILGKKTRKEGQTLCALLG